eukprot:c20585_g8_i1.p2 GENE.c20585_g8_i1~~c20585_g8_i1.p2  ORF type:complete len:272 (+),score=35.25 c20585_g8_i1:130-945(+)
MASVTPRARRPRTAAPSRKRTADEYTSEDFDERPTKKPRVAALSCVFKDCSHSCKYLSLMEIHCRTHTHEKPFHCPAAGCSHTCTQKTNLKTHYDFHHKDRPLADKVLDFLIEELKVATPAAAALAQEAFALATGATVAVAPVPTSDRPRGFMSFSDSAAPVRIAPRSPSSDAAHISRQTSDEELPPSRPADHTRPALPSILLLSAASGLPKPRLVLPHLDALVEGPDRVQARGTPKLSKSPVSRAPRPRFLVAESAAMPSDPARFFGLKA